MSPEIRNFSIIAHIDHGKTTLTDQLLKKTGTIAASVNSERILDSNPIEQERGITIKLAPVTMYYTLPEDLRKTFHFELCTLNLIDTPGHVDFSYEVSRSLSACEGAVLLVDATQGIQAQTVAHAREALNLNLRLLPVVNKIDLPYERGEEVMLQIRETFEFAEDEIIRISAKTGEGVDGLLRGIVRRLPRPKGSEQRPLRALVFNSMYDVHLGVIAFVRIIDGIMNRDQNLKMLAGKKEIRPKEIGIFTPTRTKSSQLKAGEVGYIATGLKDVRSLMVGDTIIDSETAGAVNPLPGFRSPQPVVYADVYPAQERNFNELKNAIERLKLTDAAIDVHQTYTPALGAGFRLGFLGIFHGEITKERLKREQGMETIFTKPTVEYGVETKDGKSIRVKHPSEFPDPTGIAKIMEPMVEVNLMTPRDYLGPLMQLVQAKRGVYRDTQYIGKQARVIYHLPLPELIDGFVDAVKSVSSGFASFDYRHIDPQPVDAVKLSVLINHQEVEPLARIIVRELIQKEGKALVERIKALLPRQLFAVPIQAAVGGKIIARETKPAARKDVTAKLYGGDRTRRMKLLEKQKKGKAKLAKFGRLTIPQEAIMNLMRA